MKLTFNTKGKVEIDYNVWIDNSEKEVENATITVIKRCGDSVVNEYSVQEKILNNEREYLAAMLGCRPENVDVSHSDVKCTMSSLELSISGTYVFEIDDELELYGLPNDDEICENIQALMYESIHEHRDFIDDSTLRSKLNDIFWSIMEVDFYYDYKPIGCNANLEK